MSSLPDEFPDSLPVSEARDQLAELLNRASYTGQITYVTKRGQRVGAIVPVHVAQAAEAAEAAYLARLAAEAEAELDAGGTTRPLSQVLADLELNPGPVAPAPREGDPPAVPSTGDAERRPRT
jgi:antitoxin Phd